MGSSFNVQGSTSSSRFSSFHRLVQFLSSIQTSIEFVRNPYGFLSGRMGLRFCHMAAFSATSGCLACSFSSEYLKKVFTRSVIGATPIT